MLAFAQAADPAAVGTLDDGTIGMIILAAFFAVATLSSVIPAGIAFMRGHRSAWAILLVCVFFGWTCIGWVIGLIWAMSDTGRGRR
jgi:hypothetical protein